MNVIIIGWVLPDFYVSLYHAGLLCIVERYVSDTEIYRRQNLYIFSFFLRYLV